MWFYKLNGYRTIVYNLHHDYFYEIFAPIYLELEKDPRIKIFFSYQQKNKNLLSYLKKKNEVKRLIPNQVARFIYFDLFICPEVTGPDFPYSRLKTKTLEIYHGIGTYNLYQKKNVLNRFAIHFAIGPKFNEFINFAYQNKFPKPKVYDIGYPKLDELFNLKKNDQQDFQTILYAPHWDKFGSLHKFEEKILLTLAEFDMKILVKPHNYLYFEYKNWEKRLENICAETENLILIKEANTQKLYPQADIMITDCGTTAPFEFSILQKPFLIYRNKKWFENNKNFIIEAELEKIAFSFEDLAEMQKIIEKIRNGMLEHKITQQRGEQQKLVKKYLYNPGCATEKATTTIRKELGLKKK